MGSTMKVTAYVAGKPRGERTVFSDKEIVEAAGNLLLEEKLERCAIRFEDENGSGGWMLISARGQDASGAIDDVPKKHRHKVRPNG